MSDPTDLAAEARRDAVRDAAARAETLAGAAGVSLGPLQSLTEGGGDGGPAPIMRGAMMAEAAVPLAEGEIDITARVTLVYEIID